MAESTHQPEKEIFTPGNVSRGEGPEYRGELMDSRQLRGESAERDVCLQRRGESEWALPELSQPHRPPGESTTGREVPSRQTDKSEGEPSRQEYPTPEQ